MPLASPPGAFCLRTLEDVETGIVKEIKKW